MVPIPPNFRVERSGDVLLAASLLPAMRRGEPIEIDRTLPVSPRLLKAVQTIQDVFVLWNPKLQRIQVRAERIEEPKRGEEWTGAFFTGGLDGSYTLLKHAREITHLVFIKGIDMQVDNETLFQEVLAMIQRVAEWYRKTLVIVESNIRFFGHANQLGWDDWSGAGLSSVVLAMNTHRFFFPASRTYAKLNHAGTNLLTDPLWSTEATEIFHDGMEAARSQKLLWIAREDSELLSKLRVCWQDAGCNCGHCERCLQMMALLRALKLSPSSFPPLKSLDPLYRLRLAKEGDQDSWLDIWLAVRDNGDRPLARALARSPVLYSTRRCLLEIDQLMFSGRLKKCGVFAGGGPPSTPSG